MEGRLKELLWLAGGEWVVSFTTRENPNKLFNDLKDADVDVQIKKHNPKRSRDANSLCWALCADIGNAIRPPVPKEEVYRKAIREVGVFEPLPIKAEAVEAFQRRWAAKGTGWFAEVIDDSKLAGYKLVFAYYGSSTYDTVEMSRLIDCLVEDARQMGIPIPASKEQEDALKAWGAKA